MKSPQRLSFLYVSGWLWGLVGLVGLGFSGVAACDPPSSTEVIADSGSEGIPETLAERPELPEPIVKPAILTPTIGDIQLQAKTTDLPAELSKDPSLSLGNLEGTGFLLGGKAGLFQIKEGKAEKVDSTSVIGIAPWEGRSFVVAQRDRLALWDGSLQPTRFHEQMDGSPFTALAARGDKELWLGTTTGLWQFADPDLQKFPAIGGVKRLVTLPNAPWLLIQDTTDAFHLLRRAPDGSWQKLSFASEGISLQDFLPFGDQKFWGLTDQGLALRLPKDDQAAWWPFRLKPNTEGAETLAIQRLAYDPSSQLTWAITSQELYRLDQEQVGRLARPSGMGEIVTAFPSADGSLWLADAAKLYRIGQDGPPVSYAKQIQPFLEQNCNRCHVSPGGVAFSLTSFDDAKKWAFQMVTEITAKRMPPDERPLIGGDAETLRRWIDGAYQP